MGPAISSLRSPRLFQLRRRTAVIDESTFHSFSVRLQLDEVIVSDTYFFRCISTSFSLFGTGNFFTAKSRNSNHSCNSCLCFGCPFFNLDLINCGKKLFNELSMQHHRRHHELLIVVKRRRTVFLSGDLQRYLPRNLGRYRLPHLQFHLFSTEFTFHYCLFVSFPPGGSTALEKFEFFRTLIWKI